MSDTLEDYDYVPQHSLYIVELERDAVVRLVDAAHRHAETLGAAESRKLADAANSLSAQTFPL